MYYCTAYIIILFTADFNAVKNKPVFQGRQNGRTERGVNKPIKINWRTLTNTCTSDGTCKLKVCFLVNKIDVV